MNLEKTVLGKSFGIPQVTGKRNHPTALLRNFGNVNPKEFYGIFGDCVAAHSCGMAHIESVCCDSFCVSKRVETPWPLLAQHYCPEGCPKFPRAKLAAMSSKPKAPLAAAASSRAAGAKPKPPLPPTEDAASSNADGAKSKPKQPSLPAKAAAAAAEDVTNVRLAAENAAKERPKAQPAKKMPPLMMRCAASMGEGPSGHKAFLGMLPKFPPARQAAEVAMKSAGGTEQDSMPSVGPWLSPQYQFPVQGKRDTWSLTKCNLSGQGPQDTQMPEIPPSSQESSCVSAVLEWGTCHESMVC
eukprot:s1349_g8.t1